MGKQMPARNEKEVEGLAAMKMLTADYEKSSEEGNELVKKFLLNVDEELMLQFLRGRKYKSKYAWETLKKNAEVRYVKYPEIFSEVAPHIASLSQRPVSIILKNRDKLGRRIMFFDSRRWNPDCHSIPDLTQYGIYMLDKLIKDEDCMTNGIVIIHDYSALGMKHIKQYSVDAIRQFVSIFWHSYPIRIKAVYLVNTPYLLSCAISLARYFFPEKLKERLNVWSTNCGYTELHKIFPREILPRASGGLLDEGDAADPEMTPNFKF